MKMHLTFCHMCYLRTEKEGTQLASKGSLNFQDGVSSASFFLLGWQKIFLQNNHDDFC